jgi:hypothetical protein
MFCAAKKSRRVPAVCGQKCFHLETSDLTGASLDKAGSIHPLMRVGII